MATRWKKCKDLLAFVTFAVGLTLLLGSLLRIGGMLLASNGEMLRAQPDYQLTRGFQQCVADRLQLLLRAVTKNTIRLHSAQGNTTEDDTLDGQEDADWLVINDYGARRTPEQYIEEISGDQNLLFAVTHTHYLRYTNIESLESRIGRVWWNDRMGKEMAEKGYNFCLWFNRAGDGRIEVVKDGETVEVYGDGVDNEDGQWYLPGYRDLLTQEDAKNVVVFLAAAKEPVNYTTDLRNQDNASAYYSRLYAQQREVEAFHLEMYQRLLLVAAAVGLLYSCIFLRARLAAVHRALAARLRRVPMGCKLAVWILLLVWFLFGAGGGGLQTLLASLRDTGKLSKHVWVDCLQALLLDRNCYGLPFWTLYLTVLDLAVNKSAQRTPLLDTLRTKELALPLAQRMVRRYRVAWTAAFLALPALGLGVGAFKAVFADSDSFVQRLAEARPGLPVAAMTTAGGCLLLLAGGLCIGAGWRQSRDNHRLARQLEALCRQIDAVHDGDLGASCSLPQDAELHAAAEKLSDIQAGLRRALEEQVQSERMKVELVTNVSHDIKTPLTAIISYIELLKQEPDLSPAVQDFVQVLEERARRLKQIVQDVFEISKAAAGQLPMRPERLDLGKLLRQTLAEMEESIDASGLAMKLTLPQQAVPVFADGQRLYRVFQNLLQNALQYSLAGSRVHLVLQTVEGEAVVQLKNTSAQPLEESVDFTARFVRGDPSRTDGGSGLGLSIAQSFTEACGGRLQVTVDADLFCVTVRLPLLTEPEDAQATQETLETGSETPDTQNAQAAQNAQDISDTPDTSNEKGLTPAARTAAPAETAESAKTTATIETTKTTDNAETAETSGTTGNADATENAGSTENREAQTAHG